MRTRAKVDTNHGEIVLALRDCGCFVQSLAALGHGCPDVLAWTPYRRLWLLLEIKSGPRDRLTPDEENWIATSGGPVAVVRTVEEALRAIGLDGPPT